MARSASARAVVTRFAILLPRSALISADGGRKSHFILRSSTVALTPSPKTEPGDVRESNQPEGLERILYEEATQCRADRSVLTSSGRGSGERTEGSRGL